MPDRTDEEIIYHDMVLTRPLIYDRFFGVLWRKGRLKREREPGHGTKKVSITCCSLAFFFKPL